MGKPIPNSNPHHLLASFPAVPCSVCKDRKPSEIFKDGALQTKHFLKPHKIRVYEFRVVIFNINYSPVVPNLSQ